jgi:hypothetical protein
MSQPIVPIFVPTPDQPNFIDGDLEVGGDVLVDGNLTVKGISSLGTLDLANISTDGTLHVGGITSLLGNVTTSNNLTVDGTLVLPNIQSGTGTLSSIAINSAMQIVVGSESGGGTVASISSSDTNLILTPDPIVTTGTISINPAPVFTGNVTASEFVGSGSGISTLAGALSVSGNGSVGGNLAVTGTLTTTGATQLGSLTTTANAVVDGALTVDGNTQLGIPSGSQTTATSHNTLDSGTGIMTINVPTASAGLIPLSVLTPNAPTASQTFYVFGNTTTGSFNAADFVWNYLASGSNTNNLQIGLKGAAKMSIDGLGQVIITNNFNVTGGNSQLGTSGGTNTTFTSHNSLDDGSGNISIVGNAQIGALGGSNTLQSSKNVLDDGTGHVTTAGTINSFTPGMGTNAFFTNFFGLSLNVNLCGFLQFFNASTGLNFVRLGVNGNNGLTIDNAGNITSAGGMTSTANTLNAIIIPSTGSGTFALVSQIPSVPINVVYNVNSTGILSLFGSAKGFSLGSNMVTFPSLDGNNYLITCILSCTPTTGLFVTSAIKVTDSSGNSSLITNASVPTGATTTATSLSNSFPYFNNIGSATCQLTFTNVSSVIGVLIFTQIL